MAEYSITIEPVSYEVTLARIGPQGRRGEPGQPGAAGGETTSATAGENLSGYMAVVYDGSGNVLRASCNNALHANKVVGITLGAALASSTATIKSANIIEESTWTWTVDQPIFLGLNGLITQTVPVGALFTQVLGVAIAPTRIIVNIQPAIFMA